MARWQWNRGGASFEPLYERSPFTDYAVATGQLHPDYRSVPPTTTLAKVIDELGLDPLSKPEQQQMRLALSAAIEAGMKAWQLSAPGGGLKIVDVQVILRRIAKILKAVWNGSTSAGEMEEIERTLHGAETGFHRRYDLAIALLLTDTLAVETGQDRARDRVLNFRRWPRTVAAACLKAAEDLGKIKGKGGRPSLDWYPDFKRVLTCIAEKNSISRTIEINRETGKPQGRFIELAERFEELLPPMLRSPSLEAMAKRLQSKT
jgi:hypothetical protein